MQNGEPEQDNQPFGPVVTIVTIRRRATVKPMTAIVIRQTCRSVSTHLQIRKQPRAPGAVEKIGAASTASASEFSRAMAARHNRDLV